MLIDWLDPGQKFLFFGKACCYGQCPLMFNIFSDLPPLKFRMGIWYQKWWFSNMALFWVSVLNFGGVSQLMSIWKPSPWHTLVFVKAREHGNSAQRGRCGSGVGRIVMSRDVTPRGCECMGHFQVGEVLQFHQTRIQCIVSSLTCISLYFLCLLLFRYIYIYIWWLYKQIKKCIYPGWGDVSTDDTYCLFISLGERCACLPRAP